MSEIDKAYLHVCKLCLFFNKESKWIVAHCKSGKDRPTHNQACTGYVRGLKPEELYDELDVADGMGE